MYASGIKWTNETMAFKLRRKIQTHPVSQKYMPLMKEKRSMFLLQ
jgi:hypothetical protein